MRRLEGKPNLPDLDTNQRKCTASEKDLLASGEGAELPCVRSIFHDLDEWGHVGRQGVTVQESVWYSWGGRVNG